MMNNIYNTLKFHELYKLVEKLKEDTLSSEEKENIIKECPRYVRIWFYYWDDFKNPQAKVLPKEHELAWGLWCIIHKKKWFEDRIYMNLFEIPHDRRIPLLKKVEKKIDTIMGDDLFNSLPDNKHRYYYMSIFFNKTIFLKTSPNSFTINFKNMMVGHATYLKILDIVKKPVKFHPANPPHILDCRHPNLDVPYVKEEVDQYCSRVRKNYLEHYINDDFWEWCCRGHDKMICSIETLRQTPRQSIGEKAKFLWWNKDSVIKYRHLFKKEILPILDFYLKNHFLFDENVPGKIVMEAYRMNHSMTVSEECLMM